MKICLAISGTHFKLQKGGAELQAYLLYRHFIKKGHEVYYVYNRNNKSENITDVGVNFLPIDKPFTKPYIFLSWNKINMWLKKIDVDLYYQRGLRYNNIIQRFAKRHNKKFVLGISMESQCYKKYPKFSKTFGIDLINMYLDNSCIKNADWVISQTLNQKRLIEQNFGRKSIVIYNGHPVPSPPFKKSKPSIITWIGCID